MAPTTAVAVYVPEVLAQTTALPVIAVGVPGAVVPVNVKVLGALLPHALFAVTEIVPEIDTAAKFTVIVLLPLVTAGIVTVDKPPEVTPVGKVQVYDTALVVADTVQVAELKLQILVEPLKVAGVNGALLMVIVLGKLLPQAALLLTTDKLPEVNPASNATGKELPVVVTEVYTPAELTPAGKVQVYPVAPETAVAVQVAELNPHTNVLPTKFAGVIVTRFNAIDRKALLPQLVFAFTDNVPEVKAGSNVTTMVLEPVVAAAIVTGLVPDTEVTPEGSVHV